LRHWQKQQAFFFVRARDWAAFSSLPRSLPRSSSRRIQSKRGVPVLNKPPPAILPTFSCRLKQGYVRLEKMQAVGFWVGATVLGHAGLVSDCMR
jgi:hypothetical protein